MTGIEQQHAAEVSRRERFQFGKNWANFLQTLTPEKIKLAEASLCDYLGVTSLVGRSFIDIGSGSGLFSLAARRLGARVHSFDYDSNSFACTKELRRRYYENDPDWKVEQASVLDENYIMSLPKFDVVYSWGVLHHTGEMWHALDNVKRLSPIGGTLFIAIYNDRGDDTDRWEKIKKRYNSLPLPFKLPYALSIVAVEEYPRAKLYYKDGNIKEYINIWRNYHTISLRGMNQWHDWIDWIGGYPYERATVAEIVDFYAKDGFRLQRLGDSSGGYGCSQFVFKREAASGVLIDEVVPGGDSLVRRHARRVLGPFEKLDGEWRGHLPERPFLSPGARLVSFRGGRLVGHTQIDGDRVAVGQPDEKSEDLQRDPTFVLGATVISVKGPFTPQGRHGWAFALPAYRAESDSSTEPRVSSVGLFENGVELSKPHSPHFEVELTGRGRYSHWGDRILFSTSDNSDPNTNGRNYTVVAVALPLPPERSLAMSFGLPLTGFERGQDGWTASLPPLPDDADPLFLMRDDHLIGPLRTDRSGQAIVADLGEAASEVERSRFHVVSGRHEPLTGPFTSSGDKGWSMTWPTYADLADNNDFPARSPVFLFQGGAQLPFPHAAHADIANLGGGRFSHWRDHLFLSMLDDGDPNRVGAALTAFIPLSLKGVDPVV